MPASPPNRSRHSGSLRIATACPSPAVSSARTSGPAADRRPASLRVRSRGGSVKLHRIAGAGQDGRGRRHRRQRVEAARPPIQSEIVGGRMSFRGMPRGLATTRGRGAPGHGAAAAAGHRVDDADDRGHGADAEREREYRGRCERLLSSEAGTRYECPARRRRPRATARACQAPAPASRGPDASTRGRRGRAARPGRMARANSASRSPTIASRIARQREMQQPASQRDHDPSEWRRGQTRATAGRAPPRSPARHGRRRRSRRRSGARARSRSLPAGGCTGLM